MGALIPLALTLAPELARWLCGNDAGKTVDAVSQAIQTAAGTEDAVSAAMVLQQDPAKSASLRLALAQIAAECETAAQSANLDQLTAALRSSGATAGSTPGSKAATAWSTPAISAVVLLTFAVVMVLVLVYGMPAGSETAANMLLGTLAAMATSVVSYWVGSSAGSARKDDRLTQAALSNK